MTSLSPHNDGILKVKKTWIRQAMIFMIFRKKIARDLEKQWIRCYFLLVLKDLPIFGILESSALCLTHR